MNPATRLMVEKLTALAVEDKTYAEAAVAVGSSYHYVANFVRRYGIPLRQLTRGRKATAPADPRSQDMRALYESGQTLNQISQQYGITRERVRQILFRHFGTRSKDGGATEIRRQTRVAFQKKRDSRMMKAWGCTYRQYREVLNHADRPTRAFNQQRSNARTRGIGWELSLWQWWKIWEQSGHWADRGRGRAYHMCRLNDTGPYSIDNVYIATGTENMQDYWVNRRAAEALEAA